MKIPYTIGNKTFLIEPYNTFQEKEILLLASFEVFEFDRVFEILGVETDTINDLTDDEQKVLLYKFREISLGDEIDIKFKCENCQAGNDGVLTASNFLIPSKRNDYDVKKLNMPVTDETLQEFVDVDVDELDIDQFEDLKQRVKENQNHIDFTKTCACLHCRTEKKFDLSDPKYIIEIMSDDTLMTLYKSYNYLIFFGKYSKEGIDSMYPFERSIFIGLLNQTKEDMTK